MPTEARMLDRRRSSDLLAAKADPEQSHHPCIGSRQDADTPDGPTTNMKLLPPCDGRPHFANGTLTPVKRLCTSVRSGCSSERWLEVHSVGENAWRTRHFVAVQAHGASRTFCWSTARSILWCLTFELRRGPTSKRQARAVGGRIFHRTGLAFCCRSRLSSNVRHHKVDRAVLQQKVRLAP